MKTGRVLGQYCFSFEKWPAFKGGQVKQLLTAYLGSQTQLRQKEHKKKGQAISLVRTCRALLSKRLFRCPSNLQICTFMPFSHSVMQ